MHFSRANKDRRGIWKTIVANLGGEFIFHAHNCYGNDLAGVLFYRVVVSGTDKVVAVSNYVASSLNLPQRPLESTTLTSVGWEIARSFAEDRVIKVASCCSLIHYKGWKSFLTQPSSSIRQKTNMSFSSSQTAL